MSDDVVYLYPDQDTAFIIITQLGLGRPRDLGALVSALVRPQAVVWGIEAYPTLHMKAAALLDAINRSHPMLDGNKRLSYMLVWRFYDMNGYRLQPTDITGADAFIRAVGGEHVSLEEIADWLAVRVVSR